MGEGFPLIILRIRVRSKTQTERNARRTTALDNPENQIANIQMKERITKGGVILDL